MQDQRIVKLLVRNRAGSFLVLEEAMIDAIRTTRPDLPGGPTHEGESDIAALDRILRARYNVFFQTQEAVHVGFDAEYEPGEGLITRVLYLLKIEDTHVPLAAGREAVQFTWEPATSLRGFDPPFQVLVQTALDFYVSEL